MDATFLAHIETLPAQLDRLLQMPPVKPSALPKEMPKAGIYLLSEGARHLYTGRSNGIRDRIGRHCLPGATHRMAAFAFRLAREATGNLRPTYRKGAGSRSALMDEPVFHEAFVSAKVRIRQMDLRFVAESHPVRQTLLEVYVAEVLDTPYNDFDNH